MSMAMNPECPPTTQGEIKQSPHHGHQRVDITNNSSQNTANELTHKPPNGANANKGLQGSAQLGQQTNMDRRERGTPTSKNARSRYCQSTSMTHKNQLTMPKSVAQKQQHYSTLAPHSAAYQNVSTTASIIQNRQGLSTQMQNQLS